MNTFHRFALTCLGLLLTVATFAQPAEKKFSFTTSDSTRLYVRIVGQGEPCLFLHGGPGSTSHYFEASGGSRIEQNLQMIYIDLRGSGRSGSAPTADYSLKRLAKDLDELRRHLGYPRWHVMGHSFAGMLLTEYALAYPKTIRSLVYVNCTLNLNASATAWINFGIKELGITDPRPYHDPAVPVLERMGRISQQLEEKGVWYKLMFRTAEAKAHSDSVSFKAIQPFNTDYGQKVWSAPEYMQDHTARTAGITAPVLVIAGTRDYAVGPDHYRLFRFPNARIVRYQGGHAPYQEDADWFVQTVGAFLTERNGKAVK